MESRGTAGKGRSRISSDWRQVIIYNETDCTIVVEFDHQGHGKWSDPVIVISGIAKEIVCQHYLMCRPNMKLKYMLDHQIVKEENIFYSELQRHGATWIRRSGSYAHLTNQLRP